MLTFLQLRAWDDDPGNAVWFETEWEKFLFKSTCESGNEVDHAHFIEEEVWRQFSKPSKILNQNQMLAVRKIVSAGFDSVEPLLKELSEMVDSIEPKYPSE